MSLTAIDRHKKTDARIVRTLHAIQQAFFAILRQKAYDTITIADILAQADINRTTFYKYYANKNDLAHSMVEDLKNTFFIPVLDKRFSVSWEQFSQYFPDLLHTHHDKLRLLWHIHTPTTNLKQDCYQLVKAKYIAAASVRGDSDENLALQGHMYASFTLALIEYSIQNDKLLSPSEIRQNLQRVVQGILH